MKIFAIVVLRKREKNADVMAEVFELSNFGFFQRGRYHLVFASFVVIYSVVIYIYIYGTLTDIYISNRVRHLVTHTHTHIYIYIFVCTISYGAHPLLSFTTVY